MGLYHSAKFGYDRCSSFYNMNISIFGTFGWKIPIHAPIWAIWSPKSAAISTKAKKGTSLRESASFEPLSVKMWSVVCLKRGINKKRNIVNISPICPKAPYGRISTKFFTAVEVMDLITCNKFFSDRLRYVDFVEGQK